jgi:hypothetical protein
MLFISILNDNHNFHLIYLTTAGNKIVASAQNQGINAPSFAKYSKAIITLSSHI